MKNSLKAVLFVTSLSPALISLGVARLIAGSAFWDAFYYVLAGLAGSLVTFYIISALQWYSESFPFIAKKIESNDVLLMGVVVTYIFPFFTKANEITLGVVVLLVALGGLIFWFSDVTLPSPLMRVFGFRFYKAESANGIVYTLITTREILDPKDVKHVKRISGSMLFEEQQ